MDVILANPPYVAAAEVEAAGRIYRDQVVLDSRLRVGEPADTRHAVVKHLTQQVPRFGFEYHAAISVGSHGL